MERTPEPELMDDERQAVAYSEADFTAAHEHFVALCEAFVGRDGLGGTVLDLGCGPCDVTVRLARRFPRAVFHGVDGAEAMLALGRARVERAGLGARIRLARAVLPHDPPPLDRYDAVVSNSLLHHLHDPSVLWAAVARRARAGAPVVVMDLRRPDSPETARALVDAYAGGEPEVLRRDFYDSLRAAFTPAEVRAQVAAAGLGLDVRAVGDRHLVAQGRR